MSGIIGIYKSTKINNNSSNVPTYSNILGTKKSVSLFIPDTTTKTTTCEDDSSNNDMQNIATALSLAAAVIPLIDPVKNLLKSDKANSTDSQKSVNEANKSSEDMSAAITDCKKNGNIEGLRTKVQNDTASQQAQAAEIEQMGVQEQQALQTANAQLTEKNKAYDDAKAELTTAKEAESTAESASTEADNACTEGQDSYDKAEASEGEAQSDVATAESNVTSAQAAATAQAAAANPKDTTAQTRLTQAKAALTQAKAKLTAATAAKNTAKTNLEAAKKNKTTKKDELAKAQSERKNLDIKVRDIAAELPKINSTVKAAKTALETANANKAKATVANNQWKTTIAQGQQELSNYSAPADKK